MLIKKDILNSNFQDLVTKLVDHKLRYDNFIADHRKEMFQIYEIFKRLEQNVMDQKIKLTILAGGQQVESHSIGM